jgi:hypothetical protein
MPRHGLFSAKPFVTLRSPATSGFVSAFVEPLAEFVRLRLHDGRLLVLAVFRELHRFSPKIAQGACKPVGICC